MTWYWRRLARAVAVTFHLDRPVMTFWRGVYGVRLGRWFVGVVVAAPPVAPRQWSRGTRAQIFEYLGTVRGASVAEMCAALGVHDLQEQRRINSMAGYLYRSGELRAIKQKGTARGGRGFRFNIYSLVRP